MGLGGLPAGLGLGGGVGGPVEGGGSAGAGWVDGGVLPALGAVGVLVDLVVGAAGEECVGVLGGEGVLAG